MKTHRSQDAAIAAAFREAKKLLLERRRVCLQLFAGAGMVSLFELRGGTRTLLGKFLWTAKESE